MLVYNFKYELKILYRNRWVQLLTVLLLVFVWFLLDITGKQRVDKRMGDIQAAQTMVELSDAKTLANLKAIENGEDLGLSNWIFQPTQ